MADMYRIHIQKYDKTPASPLFSRILMGDISSKSGFTTYTKFSMYTKSALKYLKKNMGLY